MKLVLESNICVEIRMYASIDMPTSTCEAQHDTDPSITTEAPPVDLEAIQDAVRVILRAVGDDPDRPGLKETPRRVAKMYEEMFAGLRTEPARHLRVTFPETYNEMVLVRDISFNSMCEHHLLPFNGVAHVAYIPDGSVTGLSKLARVVDEVARRPQVQERMTQTIADMVEAELKTAGAAVVVEAEHSCMSMSRNSQAGQLDGHQRTPGHLQDECGQPSGSDVANPQVTDRGTIEMIIQKEYKFYAAHRNEELQDKCSNIHGHRYGLLCFFEVERTGSITTLFSDFDAKIEPLLKNTYDHSMLINVYDSLYATLLDHTRRTGESLRLKTFERPTSLENLAHQLFSEITDLGFRLQKIELRETDTSTLSYTREDWIDDSRHFAATRQTEVGATHST